MSKDSDFNSYREVVLVKLTINFDIANYMMNIDSRLGFIICKQTVTIMEDIMESIYSS